MVPKRKQKHARSFIRQNSEKFDFVSKLFSKELTLKVFSFLSLQDLIQCAVVSVHWSLVANDEMLWKPLFMHRFQIAKENQRLKGSWKLKYKIHHNWVIGNCSIHDFHNVFDNDMEDMKYHLQFQNDTLFIANTRNSIIDVWEWQGKSCCIKKQQLQSVELALYPNVHITFLDIVADNRYLVAGYSNGGFTLWRIDQGDIDEAFNYFSTMTKADHVVSICMNDPIIILNTDSQKLFIFRIHHRSSCAVLDLIHYLESPICWSSLAIHIQKHGHQQWKVLICCGISGDDYSLWVMEVILSLRSVVSTRQGYTISSQYGPTPYNRASSKITAMAFSPPYLITAHPNNTIKQYRVVDDKNREDAPSSGLSLALDQILYGHTFQVDALSIHSSKLLSADKSGVKVWDLTTEKDQVSLYNYPNQSQMNELPDATIACLRFDQEKIVAIVQSKSTGYSIRLWTFNI